MCVRRHPPLPSSLSDWLLDLYYYYYYHYYYNYYYYETIDYYYWKGIVWSRPRALQTQTMNLGGLRNST